ncbi:MAG: hypothetical protein K2L82_07185 [Lachnospiraceae bacterium]|nr:hypothetical protein [Lachnospiraceae bacterium]
MEPRSGIITKSIKSIKEEKQWKWEQLYIKNTNEVVVFYQEAFGLILGYNEKSSDGKHIFKGDILC